MWPIWELKIFGNRGFLKYWLCWRGMGLLRSMEIISCFGCAICVISPHCRSFEMTELVTST